MKRIFYLAVFVLTGCYHYDDQSNVDTPVPLLSLDTTVIREHDLIIPQSTMEFYRARDFSLFWSDSGGVTPAVDSMMNFIHHANQYGLIAKDYHLDELELLFSDSTSRHKPAIIDLLLTDSYLALHHHLKHGRLHPKTLERFDLLAKVDREAIASLGHPSWNIIRTALDVQEPQIEQYHFLKEALKAFVFSAGNDSLTLRRSRTIALNMERWRWEEQLPDRYVSVNIPAYVLRVIEKDSLWLQSDVIVGKASTPTPVLESVIRSFIIYPYWHAPHSIATKEILPVLKTDPSYLGRNNFEVLDGQGSVIDAATIQWDAFSAEHFPFTLRQREGFENSMGIIKFNFVNNFGVYLHDTNSRDLFSRKHRDLSHGCVRVKQAVELAHYLVREDDIYVSPDDLDQYLSLQQRVKIDLRDPIPVKLQYFTCEVEKGALRFYDDIYKKDSVMLEALYSSGFQTRVVQKQGL